MALKEDELKRFMIRQLKDRLETYGISRREVSDDFDLVKSGLMDSLSFVQLVGAMEEEFNVEIDFENVMEDENFTTVEKIIALFKKNLDDKY